MSDQAAADFQAFRDAASRSLRDRVTLMDAGCWEWTGPLDKDGYGRGSSGWRVEGARVSLAHRYVYALMGGRLIPGLVMDHLCRKRNCVNPSHLEQVTQGENVRRAWVDYDTCVNGHSLADAYVSNGRRQCATCRKAISSRVGKAARARARADRGIANEAAA